MVRLSALALLARCCMADSCTDGSCLAKDSALLQKSGGSKELKVSKMKPSFIFGPQGGNCPEGYWGVRFIEVCKTAFDQLGMDGSQLQVVFNETYPSGCRKTPDGIVYNKDGYHRGMRPNTQDTTVVCMASLLAKYHGDDAVKPCGANVALHKQVTCSDNIENCGATVVDGNHANAQKRQAPQAELESCTDEAWVQVDLGEMTRLNQVKLFGFADGERQYCGRKVEISQDGILWEQVKGKVHMKPYDDVEQPDKGTTMWFTYRRPYTARYVKVTSSRNNMNSEAVFLDIEATCNWNNDCCPTTTTTTMAPEMEPETCHGLSQEPNRCGPNIGRCNPDINDDPYSIHCMPEDAGHLAGWCEYYNYYADEWGYDYDGCWNDHSEGKKCAGESFTQGECTINLHGNYYSEETCNEACDMSYVSHLNDCRSQKPASGCVASSWNSTSGVCLLYGAGQCDSLVDALEFNTRQKRHMPQIGDGNGAHRRRHN